MSIETHHCNCNTRYHRAGPYHVFRRSFSYARMQIFSKPIPPCLFHSLITKRMGESVAREYWIAEEYKALKQIISKAIEYNNNMLSLVDLIVSYSIGLTVDCCNGRNCHNQITFQSEYDFINNVDIEGNKIYHYEPAQHEKLKTINIYNSERRIFCNQCINNGFSGECCKRCGTSEFQNSGYGSIWSRPHYCPHCGKCMYATHNGDNCYSCESKWENEIQLRELIQMAKMTNTPLQIHKYKATRKKFNSKNSNKWKVFRKDNKYQRSKKRNKYSKKRIDKRGNVKIKRQIFKKQKHSLRYSEV
eukprot:480481_1